MADNLDRRLAAMRHRNNLCRSANGKSAQENYADYLKEREFEDIIRALEADCDSKLQEISERVAIELEKQIAKELAKNIAASFKKL